MLGLDDTKESHRSRTVEPVRTRKTYESDDNKSSENNNNRSGIRPRRTNKRKLSDQYSSDGSQPQQQAQAAATATRRQKKPNKLSHIQEVPDEQMESSGTLGIDNRGEGSDFEVVSASDHSDPDADRINIRQVQSRRSGAPLTGNAYD